LTKIDINCDYGEDFGSYRRSVNEEILKYISSVNIACGFHAGDFSTMEKSVQQAMKNGVKIGAHPSFPDLQGFGRRIIKMSSKEISQLMIYQIGALAAFVKAEGGKLNHVKPHGALYNLAAVDEDVAKAISEAIAKVDDTLILYGLANSKLIMAGQDAGLKVANEIFADRTYQSDGTLTSRTEDNALITDANQSVEQVLRCVKYGEIKTIQDKKITIPADTVCIHGDGENALLIAKKLYKSLHENSVKVQ
jgi:5-oxoprolinase (ATP-hydrolysing) subunit A